jgi:hypothetical protein
MNYTRVDVTENIILIDNSKLKETEQVSVATFFIYLLQAQTKRERERATEEVGGGY